MRIKLGIPALALGVSLMMAAPAFAQVSVEVGAPGIAFDEDPGLVEIEPGLSVIPDYGEEVFYIDGYYWYRWDGRWYCASDWRGGWTIAAPPARLLGVHFGRYRNWHGGRVIRPGRPVVAQPQHQRFALPQPVQSGHRVVTPPPARALSTQPVHAPAQPARAPAPPAVAPAATHRVAPPPPAAAPHRRHG